MGKLQTAKALRRAMQRRADHIAKTAAMSAEIDRLVRKLRRQSRVIRRLDLNDPWLLAYAAGASRFELPRR